jgi:hypothetical protein
MQHVPFQSARRAAVLGVLVALAGATVQSQPRPSPVQFDATVVAVESSGIGCGSFIFVGAVRVHVDRVLAGSVPSGEVRVLANCYSPAPGEHVRVTGTLLSPHRGSWGHFRMRHPIPVDSVPTFRVSRLDRPPP